MDCGVLGRGATGRPPPPPPPPPPLEVFWGEGRGELQEDPPQTPPPPEVFWEEGRGELQEDPPPPQGEGSYRKTLHNPLSHIILIAPFQHLRMAVDGSGCNIQHLWFDSVPCMLEYFKTNSIPLESFWLNDDVKLTNYIDRQASDGFRTTTVINVDQLNRVPPRRSRSLHLGMSRSTAGGGSSHPGTPGLATMEHRSGSASASTNSLPFTQSNASGWRQIFRSQRSSSAGNVGRVQRSHSHNAGSIQNTGRGGGGGNLTQRVGNRENSYVWRNY